MLNQLIQIPSRYAGLTTDGRLIDGLAVVSGVFLQQFQQYEQYFGIGEPSLPIGNRPPMTTGAPTPVGGDLGWTKRWHRKQHWHSFPHCLQLHQG
ncbi:MAG: hypothetical protein ACFBSF_16875 [Leptolyngbyaceae cyanobacterium]